MFNWLKSWFSSQQVSTRREWDNFKHDKFHMNLFLLWLDIVCTRQQHLSYKIEDWDNMKAIYIHDSVISEPDIVFVFYSDGSFRNHMISTEGSKDE